MRLRRWFDYLQDFAARGDLQSFFDAIGWVVARRAPRASRVIQTELGRFHCRAGTTDFIHVSPAYEREIRLALLHLAGPSTVFLDVGSCLGETSIALASGGSRCFAFEPDPDNQRNLRRNLELNGLEDRVRTFEMALGQAQGVLRFRSDPVNRGASGRAGSDAEATHVVPQERLDALAWRLGLRPDDRLVIKIDAEGMELDVLAGARELIRSHPEVTVIAESKHIDPRELDHVLRDLGLTDEVFAIDEHNVCARKVRGVERVAA